MNKFILLLYFSFFTLNAPAQMSLDQQAADFGAMIQLLNSSWANRQVHEEASGIAFMDRTQNAYQNLLQPPLMTNSEYAIFISRFLNSLSDGHINLVLNQLAPYDWAASPFTFVESREGLVLTACKMICAQISLPALVTAIDNENPEVWIQKRLEFSTGSTAAGKRYYAIRGLSQRQEVMGTSPRPRSFTISLKGTSKKVIPFTWTTPASQSTVEKKCVTFSLVGKNLVVKVPSFMCQDSLFPQNYEKGFEKFNRELLAALSSKSYNKVLIDLRGNGGGLPQPAQELISYFINEPLFWFGTRNILNPATTEVTSEFAQPKLNTAALQKLKTIPLWLLTDGSCFSQCSIFVIAAKLAGRAKLVGQQIDPGAGGLMENRWQAPSGLWSLTVPPWIALAQDGQFIEAYPLAMDLETKPAFSQFLTGSDPTLSNAVEKVRMSGL